MKYINLAREFSSIVWQASSELIKSRKPTDGKLDYSHVTVGEGWWLPS